MVRRQSHIFLLVLILFLYASLSFYQIDLPGLHYDEAFEAIPAMQLLLGQPVTAFRNGLLTLGQLSLPLMTQDYIGTLNTYLVLPFIAILGPTPVALRSMSIVVGALTLGMSYALTVRLTHQRWVGLLTALLLAVDPTFIFWNRQGVFVTAVTATIGVAAPYCWLRRLQGGSMRWSMAGAFLFGLGIYAKFLFVWLIAALVGAMILLNIGWLVKHRTTLPGRAKQLSATEILVSCLALLLGCSPLLLYNLQTGGTFLNIAQNASTSYYGVNNLAFATNFLERVKQLFTLLTGAQFWYLGNIVRNFWPPLFLVGVLILVVILSMRNSMPALNSPLSPVKIALFPFLVIGLVILAGIGTVSALWITHFAILMPWPTLAMAIGSWFILQASTGEPRVNFGLPGKKTSRFLITVALGILVITNLSSTIRYHLALTESGGLSSHSDAVYDLSDWLTQHATGQVVAMDWGLAAPITYLTHGQVSTLEVFGYEWQTNIQLTERLSWSIKQPDTLYLWRSPDEIIFDRSDAFKTLYRPLNLEETIEEAFYERSGRPILGITRLVEKGTASNPP